MTIGAFKINAIGRQITPAVSGFNFTTPATMTGITTGFVVAGNGAVACNSSNLFVAVGYNTGTSTPYYATSTNGTTWSTAGQISSGTTVNTIYNISSQGTRFVMIGKNSVSGRGVWNTSTNGTTWNSTTTDFGANTTACTMIASTANSSGKFVAVGYDASNAALFSTTVASPAWSNSSAWTIPARMNASATVCLMQAVACNSAGRFVAVGYNLSSLGMASTSTNTTTWTTPATISATTFQPYSIAVNPAGLFVVVGYAGTTSKFTTTTDGTTWSTVTNISGTGLLISVTWNTTAGRFVAVGGSTNSTTTAVPIFSTSTDGTTWTPIAAMNSTTTTCTMFGVAANSSGLFAAVGRRTTSNIPQTSNSV
jgi:hypothetical protein